MGRVEGGGLLLGFDATEQFLKFVNGLGRGRAHGLLRKGGHVAGLTAGEGVLEETGEFAVRGRRLRSIVLALEHLGELTGAVGAGGGRLGQRR